MPKDMSLSKTCILDSLLKENPAFEEMRDTPFTMISSFGIEQSEFQIDIDSSYSEAYGHLIEYLWRSFDLSTFFNKIDDNFEKAQSQIAKNKLAHNAKLWSIALGVPQMSGNELRWFQLWNRKQRKVKPIIADNAERNLKEMLLSW